VQSKISNSSSSNSNQLSKKEKELSNRINKIQTKSIKNKQINFDGNVQQKHQINSNSTRESNSAGSVPTLLRKQYKNNINSGINQLKEINIVNIDDNNLSNIGKIIINENDKLKTEEKICLDVSSNNRKEMKRKSPPKQLLTNGSPSKLVMTPPIEFNNELILPSRNIDFLSDSILDKKPSLLKPSIFNKSRIPRRSIDSNVISECGDSLRVPLLSGLIHASKITPTVSEKKPCSKSLDIKENGLIIDTLSNLMSEELN
jgi:hypothetical protein